MYKIHILNNHQILYPRWVDGVEGEIPHWPTIINRTDRDKLGEGKLLEIGGAILEVLDIDADTISVVTTRRKPKNAI